jgi:hypothetical protein
VVVDAGEEFGAAQPGGQREVGVEGVELEVAGVVPVSRWGSRNPFVRCLLRLSG